MCRLLGIAGHVPLPAESVLDAFYPLCQTGCIKKAMEAGHADGWGISGFSLDRVVYYQRRAASAIDEEALFKETARKVQGSKTPIVIAHFRKASLGVLSIANTHPFHTRDWAFAHNGTIYNPEALKLMELQPQGGTDSERFAYWLLDRVANSEDQEKGLADALREAREMLRFSSLNFLLSDGKTLYAYREVSAKDLEADETIDDRRQYYTLHVGKGEKASIVCSEVLLVPNIAWSPIPQRTLVIIPAESPLPRLREI